ncbi:MAG: hypothetical protein ACRC7N_05545 [Clostridium sp.]
MVQFSFAYDKEIARSYYCRIEILLFAFDYIAPDDLLEKEKVMVTKECYYAEKNMYGVDILAILTVSNILRKYREICEIPKEGHWII